jgi:hypothetical protein
MNDHKARRAVTICSSSKFYETAKRLAKALDEEGLQVFTPRFEFSEEFVTVTAEEKAELTLDFLGKISRSDAIFVIDEGGYTGRSVCIEVGYASALGKKVIVSEPPIEGAISALADAVIPVDDLPAMWATVL